MQIVRRDQSRCVIEIDEQVAAEDDVEPSEIFQRGGVEQVGGGEAHRFAQIVYDLAAMTLFGLKIGGDQLFRQPLQRARSKASCDGRLDCLGVDVGADDLDIIGVDKGPVFEQP